jgi:uncharacterized protein (UPF0332 family)
MEYNKEELINYRIERSKGTIEEAKLAIDNNKFHLAENRIYYSIFYLVSALALKNDFITSKHNQLLGWFNKNFVLTKIVPDEIGKIYKRSFEKRQEGDYDDMIYFNVEQVQSDYSDMLNFIEFVKKLF